MSSSLLQVVNSLFQSCYNNWEQAVRTHPVDKLLEQNCYKSAASLLQLVRFYVRILDLDRKTVILENNINTLM